MKLYNTLTRKIEEIKPLNPPEVSVYSCGPTVYDYPHIGNWFTFIRYDILIRALKSAGFNPKWVMNITDVGHLTSDADEGEDKLEVGAKREGKTAWDIAKKYTDYFVDAMEKLNMQKPDYLEKATNNIESQIELIKKLQEKGYTYATDDGVYYNTSKFADYSKLAKLDLERLKPGARVVVNPQKKNPTDFALWKFSPKDRKRDMEWDSPWGKGFPGWHLECSAIAMKYLGETLDIHAGGIDHIPTHHTNEIAQSEAVTGKKFVNHWMHANFLLVDNKKVAKSAGTFYTLEDIEKKGFSLEAFRLLVLESHYRTEAHFSWQNLKSAQNRLIGLQNISDLRWQPKVSNTSFDLTKDYEAMLESLEDDLNTPQALSMISLWLVDKIEKIGFLPTNMLEDFQELLKKMDDLLGLQLAGRSDITSEQKLILKEREKARKTKDWAKADELRKKLEEQGIGIKDTDHGPIWSRL